MASAVHWARTQAALSRAERRFPTWPRRRWSGAEAAGLLPNAAAKCGVRASSVSRALAKQDAYGRMRTRGNRRHQHDATCAPTAAASAVSGSSLSQTGRFHAADRVKAGALHVAALGASDVMSVLRHGGRKPDADRQADDAGARDTPGFRNGPTSRLV